jgi:hypothetical protein
MSTILSKALWDAVAYWLKNYVTSRKVAGSRTYAVNEFLLFYLILSAALGSGVYSASIRKEYQKQKNYVSDEENVASV